ncbi:YutD family protein [Cohnella sp. WQ 127256]|uniref:YutD family protein n=1 Tax=Cohnella sp. WQ 127256 TaxID=2938790 RepID=UPI002118A6B1|nr:YutD family protein [Cohnella sp. WQ 127256]
MIFMAGGNAYSLLHEHKSGWNPEAFRERFSEVLERFDFIVGDWGYNQLRLRGFYKEGHPRATKESVISSFVDYINEYCNFGCAHFVLTKLDSNALPPDVEISQEGVEEAIIAALPINENGEQASETAAETAAALSGGPIMRWPLKERAGGPVRVPNVTVSAVARAAADAERRNAGANANQNAQSNTSSGSSAPSRGNHPRQGQDNNSNNSRQARPYNGPNNGERRPQPQGQGGGGQTSNKPSYPPRGPRPQGGEQANRAVEDNRSSDVGNEASGRAEGSRNDNRWPGKNRRRKSFGGKPNSRPDGAPRPDVGSPRSGE